MLGTCELLEPRIAPASAGILSASCGAAVGCGWYEL